MSTAYEGVSGGGVGYVSISGVCGGFLEGVDVIVSLLFLQNVCSLLMHTHHPWEFTVIDTINMTTSSTL